MELSNAIGDFKVEPDTASDEDIFAVREALQSLTLMLAPYAPHFAEEIWEVLTGVTQGIFASGATFPDLPTNLDQSRRNRNSDSNQRQTCARAFSLRPTPLKKN